MEMTNLDSNRRLLLWSTPIMMGNLLVVIWHLLLLVKVQPTTPGFVPPLLILVNLLPLAGLVVFAKGFSKLAASMIILPLGIALVIGAYAHFLSAGADNILRMPAGELTLPFQVSAFLLVVFEALGCGIGVRMFANAPIKRMQRT
jgi:hypothetical protein